MSGTKKLLAALMCLLLLCALCLPALAEEVPYIYYTWDKDTKVLTRHDGNCLNATVLKGDEETLESGWYVAEGYNTIPINIRTKVSGDVHLILKDGCTLEAKSGITVNEGTAEDGKANSLSIYAQREGEGMGALTASGRNEDAGIGGTRENSSGKITIYGGTVTATANHWGAGIGGGVGGNGTVEIYGGTVTATANYTGAGIGGGVGGNGTVEIYGGTLTATASDYGAGIGGGELGNGTVEIYGGTVTATTSGDGAGIGGGGSGGEGKVEIYGGTVTATASGDGAAIGNGTGIVGGEVTIAGGRVSAVHTKTGFPSIGGDGCTVSLGWKDADDYVYAEGYAGSVKLTKDFLIAGTTDTLPTGTVEDLSEIAGQVLLPNRSRTVRCIGYEWNEEEKRLTRTIHEVPNPRPLTGTEIMLTGGDEEKKAVWYRVSGPVTLSARPEVRGWVNLILMDGCDLRAEKGITVNRATAADGKPNFLSIFAQREGEGMGALTVPDQGDYAGIGGTPGNSSGLITIHGGKIDATANGTGAGIGGGLGGDGTVTIHVGTVTATAMEYSRGAGIGGGGFYGSYEGQGGSGTVTIHGGTVTATANYMGAGIGGGGSDSGQAGNSTVTIYGGTVSASTETGSSGAGIGGGNKGSGTVTIYGGTVTAETKGAGAGIGVGGSSSGQGGSGEVEIYGGTVTATASSYSAAIGNGGYGSSGEVTITGGRVSAQTIGGDGCAVSLGWKDADDYVYAAGYTGSVKLSKDFLIAGTTDTLPTGTVEISKIDRKLLVPKDAAGQYAWNDKTVDFRLPGSLGEIGSGAFQGIRAATVLVPQTVKKIGPDAFRGSGVKRIKFENGNPETFDASAFSDCPFVIVYTPEKGSVYDALKDVPNVYLMPVK